MVGRIDDGYDVVQVYKALAAIPNSMFTIAAAFGNVHGVYKVGNVQLRPEILGNAQKYIKEQLKVPLSLDSSVHKQHFTRTSHAHLDTGIHNLYIHTYIHKPITNSRVCRS